MTVASNRIKLGERRPTRISQVNDPSHPVRVSHPAERVRLERNLSPQRNGRSDEGKRVRGYDTSKHSCYAKVCFTLAFNFVHMKRSSIISAC